jgi:hypothetical protein
MESFRLAVDMASGRAAAQDSFVPVEDSLRESDHHTGCCHIGEAGRCSFHLVENMDYETAASDVNGYFPLLGLHVELTGGGYGDPPWCGWGGGALSYVG